MSEVRVVVIGGGATGAGILRDLSMRGIPALLLEKADLASGTSSRFHGLLHSGARYAVNDTEAAKECMRENKILRRIGKSCVEETEGYFIRTPEDDPAFEPLWAQACVDCGIDIEQISVAEALRREGNLSKDALAAYRVPDAAVDGFRLVWHNAMSARRYGGDLRTYCRVTGIITHNGIVSGVSLVDANTGKAETISCDFVINATGSWAGEVARLAGLSVPVSPDRGTLLSFNHRFTNRVINRLRKSADGDIFVPHGSITIFGTTSIPTDRPDDTRPRSEDVFALLREAKVLFPRIADYRMLRAFAGTRPLYSPAASGRAATRNFVIIDHQEDGLKGMLTVTGGKFTSFRMMAEKTVDIAAARLGVKTPCRTAEESIIPERDNALLQRARTLFPSESFHLAMSRLGDSLECAVKIAEKNPWKKLLLCECEMVTLAEFETVASETTSHSLGDIRRRTRLGMGTCQGSFCALRATGALLENALISDTPPHELFRRFLQERWQGIRPLLWGVQLREIELERGIYGATLNISGKPDAAGSSPIGVRSPLAPRTAGNPPVSCADDGAYDVVIVGTGLSGLAAAATARDRGKRVLMVSRGGGALTIGGGTIDILGYNGPEAITQNPFAAMKKLPKNHPYALIGEEAVRASLDFLARLLSREGVTMLCAGTEKEGNAWMPTAAGTMKPTWITETSMNPHSLQTAKSFAILGITGMKDFSPQMVAAGLEQWPQFIGKQISHGLTPSPYGDAGTIKRDITALDLAAYLDSAEGLAWLTGVLLNMQSKADAVLLPSILGTKPGSAIHEHLEKKTGRKIIELICPPPSVTGLRLYHALTETLRKTGVDFVENATITRAETNGKECLSLVTSLPDRERFYSAPSFIIATGGLFSAGIQTKPGEARESIFDLPLPVPPVQDDWSRPEFFGRDSHPFASLGVSVNKLLQPVDKKGNALFTNVHFVGRALGGYDFAAEKSGSGVALATGHFAGNLI
ncbi:hypothetical protein FACS1894168_1000 [Deltaproteobacteria bacterium]|nr:hypothetical protein FACS1894168_1000 [Deltaproteobacteria bacterium]